MVSEEWPIYSLADYDGSGFLLDLCRNLLSPGKLAGGGRKKTTTTINQRKLNQDDISDNQHTTSGYLTNDDSDKLTYTKRGKQHKGGDNNKTRRNGGKTVIELSWQHLIESYNGKEDQQDGCKAQILQLYSNLQKAVR